MGGSNNERRGRDGGGKGRGLASTATVHVRSSPTFQPWLRLSHRNLDGSSCFLAFGFHSSCPIHLSTAELVDHTYYSRRVDVIHSPRT